MYQDFSWQLKKFIKQESFSVLDIWSVDTNEANVLNHVSWSDHGQLLTSQISFTMFHGQVMVNGKQWEFYWIILWSSSEQQIFYIDLRNFVLSLSFEVL